MLVLYGHVDRQDVAAILAGASGTRRGTSATRTRVTRSRSPAWACPTASFADTTAPRREPLRRPAPRPAGRAGRPERVTASALPRPNDRGGHSPRRRAG